MAAEAGQPDVFGELWDTYLGPQGFRFSWRSLQTAARLGSVGLARVFHARDPQCFNIVEPAAPHRYEGGESQYPRRNEERQSQLCRIHAFQRRRH